MHFLFASESLGELTQLFAEIAEAVGGEGQLQTYRIVEDLSARLRHRNSLGIMILLAADQRDLVRLAADRDILVEADVILLVPDGSDATVATAHSLRPSYLGSTDCDLDRVVPVLHKLLEKRTRRRQAAQGPRP